jgi:hypothetical protein
LPRPHTERPLLPPTCAAQQLNFFLPVPHDPTIRNASERKARSTFPSAGYQLSGANRLRLLRLACRFLFLFRLDCGR